MTIGVVRGAKPHGRVSEDELDSSGIRIDYLESALVESSGLKQNRETRKQNL